MDIFEIENIWFFIGVLPVVAFMYSAVGHGGASGYLALMALFGFAPEWMKPTALLLNLFVAGISFYFYWRKGFFIPKLFWVFAIASIPLSFIGGMIEVDDAIYKIILGVLLVFAILRMLNVFGKSNDKIRDVKFLQGTAIGGVIGFFSGLIGIGGGIILSPVILIFRWGKMKQAAAVSALFIWVNSAAGLAGQLSSGVSLSNDVFILVGIAILGGTAGAYFGSGKFDNKFLRYLLAFVLATASIKLLFV